MTNPATGRSVVVRINDRGPFVRGRDLDLARGAAEALGMIAQGTATVKVVRLGAGENSREFLIQNFQRMASKNLARLAEYGPMLPIFRSLTKHIRKSTASSRKLIFAGAPGSL